MSDCKINRYEEREDFMIGYTRKDEPFVFDKEDFDLVRQVTWYKDSKGYIAGTYNGKQVRMHRLLMDPPKGMVTDHKNHILADNRRSNLAVVTQSQNMMNMRPHESSLVGCNGVHQTESGAWLASICAGGVSHRLGTFADPGEAVAARKEAEKEHFGEYSYDACQEYSDEIGYVDIPGIAPQTTTNWKKGGQPEDEPKESMTFRDVIARISESTGVTKADTEMMVRAAIDEIAEVLASGDQIRLPKLGTFYVGKVAAHDIRNDVSGGTMHRVEQTRARFKPAKELRQKLNPTYYKVRRNHQKKS